MVPGTTSQKLLSTVDHLIVVMMENRSFDHFLGALRSDRAYPSAAKIDGLRGKEAVVDSKGKIWRSYREQQLASSDLPHSWKAAHLQYNQGKNNGFLKSAMGYYDRKQLPILYALADQYTVCDRWFCSVLGETWPNRFYLHAATAQGIKKYGPMPASQATVWDRLTARGRVGKNYFAGRVAWYSAAFLEKIVAGRSTMVPTKIEEFFKDARAGTLPDFAVIDPDFWANDDHPPHSVALGEAFIGSIVQAVAQSPQWARTLVVIAYDENGGFYDHVPPPSTVDLRPEFARLGFRVPAIAVGPMVRAGYVNSTQLEHVSLAATLHTRFEIASLGPRSDVTADLSSCINPASMSGAPGLPKPRMPSTEISQAMLDARPAEPPIDPEMDALLQRIPSSHLDVRSDAERLNSWMTYAETLKSIRRVK